MIFRDFSVNHYADCAAAYMKLKQISEMNAASNYMSLFDESKSIMKSFDEM